jgi:hypothetical protein
MLSSIQYNDKKLTEFLVVAALLGNYNGDKTNTAEILEKWGDKLMQGSPETRLATAILGSRTGDSVSSADSMANSH